MKKKLFFTLVMLSVPLLLSAEAGTVAKANEKSVLTTAKTSGTVKGNIKTSFQPNNRNPFLSNEDSLKIEERKKAEERRKKEEERLAEIARQKKIEELRQRILLEELIRHPSIEIRKNISVDGILGDSAIVNGDVVFHRL
ncbi:MAG: hypothetical protein K6E94_04510 [Elusimicrobiaceae bacterium]|nr:hypothetical protein [Elusimicrobiaceae bacterium]